MPKKRTRRQQLMDKCLKLFNNIVGDRDNGWCQRCGEMGHDIHHVVKRSRSTRMIADPVNGLCLCKSCHFWWHNNEDLGMLWFSQTWPDRAEYLNERNLTTHNSGYIPIQFWEDVLEELENWATDTLEPAARSAIARGMRPNG